MEKLGREGHRDRMRKQFFADEMESQADHNVLELFLSIIIPRRDVKQLSYDLINTFGSLEGVINAPIEDLVMVNGIGESSAIALKMTNVINSRISKARNNRVKKIITIDDAKEFFINELSNKTVECLVLVTLRNDGSIITKKLISTGTVNSTVANHHKIMGEITRSNCSGIILAHNHPDGSPYPSAQDINFTVELNTVISRMNIELVEHIIVANGKCHLIKESDYYICAKSYTE